MQQTNKQTASKQTSKQTKQTTNKQTKNLEEKKLSYSQKKVAISFFEKKTKKVSFSSQHKQKCPLLGPYPYFRFSRILERGGIRFLHFFFFLFVLDLIFEKRGKRREEKRNGEKRSEASEERKKKRENIKEKLLGQYSFAFSVV